MKKVDSVIKQLYGTPYYKKLPTYECFKKLKELLPSKYRDGVKFIYQKNKTLFFVLNHPIYKMEFNYNHSLIKSLLNMLKNSDYKCKNIEIESIKAFISKDFTPPSSKKREYKWIYKERSYGIFENSLEDETLHKIVENIRKKIKSNQDR